MKVLLQIELFKLFKKIRSWLGPVLIFTLIIIAYPLTVEYSTSELTKSFYSILWLGSLMTIMFSTEDIFLEDYLDGTMDQYIVNNISLPLIVFIKIFVYWLLIGVPIGILSFIFALVFTSNFESSLLIGVISLVVNYIYFAVFSFGNSLSLNKGSLLSSLVCLPLVLPILITLGKFITALEYALNFYSYIILLLGVLSIIITIIPFLISFILKAHLD